MNFETSSATLAEGSWRWLERLAASGGSRILDAVDAGLLEGSIEVVLPNGAVRLLGGRADGPRAQVQLARWMALVRLARSGSIGWYQAWAKGEWTSPDPVPLFDLFMRNRVPLGNVGRAQGVFRRCAQIGHWLRRNHRKGARRNIEFHYDLGNDFYARWLDEGMTYSSALFVEPISAEESLESAQDRKIAAMLDRLDLKPGDRLVEIGSGWGGLAEMAARDRGARVTGLTLSPSQKAYADARIARAGLADRVDFTLIDYRDAEGVYDALASVEMVEAVGERYWSDYLAAIHRLLKPGGRAAIQFIKIEDDIFEGYVRSADFIQAYIFPGGMLLSESRFRVLAERCGFAWEKPVGFGLHYAETLKRWRERYDRAMTAGHPDTGFDRAFHNMWRYYLMYCEGGFRGGGIDVVQVTLIKK